MFVYNYDSNAIITEPITSCTKNELLRTYTVLYTMLTDRGLKSILQRLDNKAPRKRKQLMQKHDATFQLVPPHLHCCNAAERAIGKWRDHFIAGLSSMDPNFSRHHLCCGLIKQATTTLNLLWPFHINPHLAAEIQLKGTFDFNRSSFASSSRTRVLIHEKTTPQGRKLFVGYPWC
jgi:hypothetical protein